MSSMKLKELLHQLTLVLCLVVPALTGRPADAWEKGSVYDEPDNWQSGDIDARIGAPISAEDFDNPTYVIDYTEERDSIRQEELLDAIEGIEDSDR